MAETKTNKLCDTSVTIEWLVETLKKSVPSADQKADLVEWSAEKIGVGQGFMSHIIKVKLSWKKDDSIPSTVVLKVPTLETIDKHMDSFVDPEHVSKEDMSKMMAEVFLPMAHKAECTLYEMFREGSFINYTWYGQEIAKDQPGVIIMEDLSRGALVHICDGLRLKQVMNIAEALASLHAWSLKNQGAWEDKFRMASKEEMKDFPNMMESCSSQLTKLKPEYFEGKFNKIKGLFDVDAMWDTYMTYQNMGYPPILVQGDMWTNNLIFDKGADGKPADSLLAIIDWQVSHPGIMTEDLARVLVSSTSPELRREHGDRVFKHYYDTLCDKMPGEKVPFTLEDVQRGYRKILPYSMSFFIFGLPLMSNSPIVEGENKEEKIESLLWRGKCILDDVIALDEEDKGKN